MNSKILKYLALFLFFTLLACNSQNSECYNAGFKWEELDGNYKVKFFRAIQFKKSEINYTNKSCSDFVNCKNCWSELSKNEVKSLKKIILDTSNWDQFDSERSQNYLYAGFAVFDQDGCLIAKIDLVEAANRYIFYPSNKNVNQGYLNYKGYDEIETLLETVEYEVKLLQEWDQSESEK